MTEPTVETNTKVNNKEKRNLWPILISAAVAIVVLSFGGSFVGARLALPTPEAPRSEAVTAQPEVESTDTLNVPAGADVRAGTGTPDSAYGKVGDVFIDIETTDVFVRTADAWVLAMNIRTSASRNLTGEQGKTGEQGQPGSAGAQGQTGKQGTPGADGSQVLLGLKAPTGTCAKNEIFIDTVEVAFYSCTDGKWSPATPVNKTDDKG